ncbi:MAG: hypothetical protein LBB76_12450 [Azoarcus sp.]|jgi:hypothetical protein|nr:hypothetical protein [Azoarcus sp.]
MIWRESSAHCGDKPENSDNKGQAVDKAIAQGTGKEAFEKDFRKIVADRGWTGEDWLDRGR